MPPNASSVLQPCDQGSIQNLKLSYRKLLLQKYLVAIEAEDLSIKVLDALHKLHSAWYTVKPTTIGNCFRHAEFSKVANSLALQQSTYIKTDPTIDEMFKKLWTLLNCSTISLNEYITTNDDVYIVSIITDKEILDMVI